MSVGAFRPRQLVSWRLPCTSNGTDRLKRARDPSPSIGSASDFTHASTGAELRAKTLDCFGVCAQPHVYAVLLVTFGFHASGLVHVGDQALLGVRHDELGRDVARFEERHDMVM